MRPKARKRLVVAKANHLITRRPEEERRQIHDSVGIGPMTDVVTASIEIPLEQRIWTCRICAGLPHARHFQVCHLGATPTEAAGNRPPRTCVKMDFKGITERINSVVKEFNDNTKQEVVPLWFPCALPITRLCMCKTCLPLASLNPLGSNPIGKPNLLTSAAATC